MADLCCSAGGASVGLHQRFPKARIVGFDLNMQPRYPFSFVKADALQVDLTPFDFVWASPPCQSYTSVNEAHRQAGRQWPDILEPIRAHLRAAQKPYIIENVPEAPLINPVMLCGTMFPSLRVFRHRHFESNFQIAQPEHPMHTDRTKWNGGDFVTLAGHPYNRYAGDLYGACGIDWMSIRELAQAIPPAYSHYLGQFIPL